MNYYGRRTEDCKISELVGKTITRIEGKSGDYELRFWTNDGQEYLMHHEQACCETVTLEDVVGDLNDLIGSPIVKAEEATSNENPPDAKPETLEWQDSYTWTFYHLATIRGTVTLRWYGESNGYYSEDVELVRYVA